jgi:hypothetical protein
MDDFRVALDSSGWPEAARSVVAVRQPCADSKVSTSHSLVQGVEHQQLSVSGLVRGSSSSSSSLLLWQLAAVGAQLVVLSWQLLFNSMVAQYDGVSVETVTQIAALFPDLPRQSTCTCLLLVHHCRLMTSHMPHTE